MTLRNEFCFIEVKKQKPTTFLLSEFLLHGRNLESHLFFLGEVIWSACTPTSSRTKLTMDVGLVVGSFRTVLSMDSMWASGISYLFFLCTEGSEPFACATRMSWRQVVTYLVILYVPGMSYLVGQRMKSCSCIYAELNLLPWYLQPFKYISLM